VLRDKQDEREVVHPKRIVEERVCIDEEDGVLERVLRRGLIALYNELVSGRSSQHARESLPRRRKTTRSAASWSGGRRETCAVRTEFA
jgi:hypothetical protein